MRLKENWVYAYHFLYVLGIVTLGYHIPRGSFHLLFAVFCACFVLYWKLYLISSSLRKRWWDLLVLAIILRLVLLFSVPQWSDDYARFLWDGQLVIEGVNPYTHTPAEVLEQWQLRNKDLMKRLFPLLNSPDYHSVYPPSNQLMFALAAYLSKGDVLTGVMMLRLLLFVFEMLAFYFIYLLLRLFHQPPQKLLLYALNPLVIMEISGNLHFEGVMVTMILAGIYFLEKNRFSVSGGFLAAAVAVKLSPILLVPAFLKKIPKTAVIGFVFAGASILLITLGPLVGSALPGFGKSISLYGNTFEFNASVYYVLRQIGYWIFEYNIIGIVGPFLKGLTLILILIISFGRKNKDSPSFLETLLLIYWVYLLLNTVVHPWYLIPAIGISIFTDKKAFLLWSFLIIISYSAYQTQPYEESSWMLFLQYLGVGLALWKDGFHRKKMLVDN
jgi:alpha-1,6-mannosyltransferase